MHLKVAYSCNDGYISQTGISLISLLQNNQCFSDITVYFIVKDVQKDNIETIKNICNSFNRSLVVIDFKDIAFDLNISDTGRHIETIYTKIFFSRIPDLDKVFYVDSDTIIIDSLEKLWNIELEDSYMGMVRTFTGETEKKLLTIDSSSFFYNDGISLCNVDYCRRHKLIEKCKHVIAEFNGNPPVLSEGVINKVCQGKIKAISPRYNMMAGLYQLISLNPRYVAEKTGYTENDLIESFQQPIVIHFLSGFYNRPWNIGCTHPLRNYYLYYKAKSPWANQPLQKSPLPLRLKSLGILLNVIGPYFFDRLKNLLK